MNSIHKLWIWISGKVHSYKKCFNIWTPRKMCSCRTFWNTGHSPGFESSLNTNGQYSNGIYLTKWLIGFPLNTATVVRFRTRSLISSRNKKVVYLHCLLILAGLTRTEDELLAQPVLGVWSSKEDIFSGQEVATSFPGLLLRVLISHIVLVWHPSCMSWLGA